MKKQAIKVLGVCLVAGLLLMPAGCAFFTAQRVGTMAAKHVATSVVKKGIKDSKEDKAKKEQAKKDQAKRDQAKRDQASRDQTRKQEAQKAQLKKSQNQKMQGTSRPAGR